MGSRPPILGGGRHFREKPQEVHSNGTSRGKLSRKAKIVIAEGTVRLRGRRADPPRCGLEEAPGEGGAGRAALG